MRQIVRKTLTTLVLCLVAGAALTGCGRKGDPEMPTYQLKQTTTDGKSKTNTEVDDNPFVLDPLL